jgi:uncharacterized protein YdeI (YjbR/CyaY-like superfamily)
MITAIEDYFSKGCGRCPRFDTPDCATRAWAQGLADLRAICRGAGLMETVKWGHPCYVHGTRNIALIGAFRGNFCLTFFHAALMKDPEGIFEKQGPNSQNPSVIRFADNAQPAQMRPIILSYLNEAVSYAQAGLKAPKEQAAIDLPEELIAALDGDPGLAEAFHALTPGRQKSYVIALNSAKKTETRVARIIGYRDKIIAGKGALDR